MRRNGLSKSKLLAWLQCHKQLWLEVYRDDLVEESIDTERRFAEGHYVGEVARRLQPGGVLIEHVKNIPKALAETKAHVDGGAPLLYEAAFGYDGVLIRADIASLRRGRVRINEVKSSTNVKDYYLSDAAIQAWVVERSGLKLDSISIQHINNQFVYPGDEQYEGLFTTVPVNKEIKPLVKEVPKWVDAARRTLAGKEPKIAMGKQCNDPYPCPLQEYCASLVPQTEFPVSILPYGGKTVSALLAEGYRDLREVPAGRLKSDNHERVRRVTVAGKPEFDPAARELMREFPYPRFYMDFETAQFAVPIWAGTRPYQNLPFQWSCHVERAPRKVVHREFLDTTGAAPMEAFLSSLTDAVERSGPIFVYHASFERGRLEELKGLFPSGVRAIDRIIKRIVDLEPIARTHYYHPDMKGSWSLKSLLPAIDPRLDYGDLDEVQEGGAAQAAYHEILAPETKPIRKAELIEALRKYCKRDTEALVRIARFFQTGK